MSGGYPWPFGSKNSGMDLVTPYGQYIRGGDGPDHPTFDAAFIHAGADLVHDAWTPVEAVESGTVSYVVLGGHGTAKNGIAIRPDDSSKPSILYLHLDYDSLVFRQVGSRVEAGQLIGQVAPWDPIDYSHLHLSMGERDPVNHNFNEHHNPLCYFAARKDDQAPVFKDAAPDGELAVYYRNSDDYLVRFERDPDSKDISVSGKVHIVARVTDKGQGGQPHPAIPFGLRFDVVDAKSGVEVLPQRAFAFEGPMGDPQAAASALYYNASSPFVSSGGLGPTGFVEYTSKPDDFFFLLSGIPSAPSSSQIWTEGEAWDTATALTGGEDSRRVRIRVWAADVAGHETPASMEVVVVP